MPLNTEARLLDSIREDLFKIHGRLGYLEGRLTGVEFLQSDIDKLKERLDTLEKMK